MGSGENVLIVEDEDQWRGIYQRAMSAQGSGQSVKVAKDLAGAEQLIDAVKFAVAFVDVGLDESDDGNVDGLRVMEKIRATGDETSIVVVTGRSGQDVLAITRDAIKKFGAYDTVGKSSIKPTDIRKLLAGGLAAYRKAAATGRMAAREALRGSTDPMRWDDQVLRLTRIKGGANSLYDYLAELIGQYLPIVGRDGNGQAAADEQAGLVYGEYWSRAAGAAVLVCFGAAEGFDQAVEAARTSGLLLGKYQVGLPVRELNGSNVKGAVFVLEQCGREEFSLMPAALAEGNS